MPSHTFSIALPEEFSPEECLWFLDRGFYDCRYRINGNTVHKLIDLEGELLLISTHFSKTELMVKMLNSTGSEQAYKRVEQHIRQWLDLDRNLTPFYKIAAGDKLLDELVQAYRGLRLIGEPDLFETLCWAIIGQQINLTFAYKMKQNLVEAYGRQVRFENQTYYSFPSPRVLSFLTIDALKGLRFSRQKADYVITLARLFCEGSISKNQLLQLPDFKARLQKLTSIRGIGPWTANYALMRSFKETRAFPRNDAGFQNAVKNIMKLETKPSQKTIEDISKHWHGWEAYAVLYLWRSLATG